MKDPAFLFYPNDFSSGTQFFTNEQVGIYLRLLLAQHQHGHLTEKQIRIICGGIPDADILSKFKMDTDGKYYNERLDNEIDKRKKHSEKQKQNANMRWHNQRTSNGIDLAMPLENRNRNENENINRNINESKSKKPKFNFELAMQQFGFSEHLITEWMQVRKTKKMTNSETAFYNFVNEVKKINIDKNELLKLIITKSWGGFEAKWYHNQQSANTAKELGATASFHTTDYTQKL